MAPFQDRRQSFLPSSLYSTAAAAAFTKAAALAPRVDVVPETPARQQPLVRSAATSAAKFLIPAAAEAPKKIELYSSQYYAACTVGGILSCGLTHTAVTPLDLVKCNMQVCS